MSSVVNTTIRNTTPNSILGEPYESRTSERPKFKGKQQLVTGSPNLPSFGKMNNTPRSSLNMTLGSDKAIPLSDITNCSRIRQRKKIKGALEVTVASRLENNVNVSPRNYNTQSYFLENSTTNIPQESNTKGLHVKAFKAEPRICPTLLYAEISLPETICCLAHEVSRALAWAKPAAGGPSPWSAQPSATPLSVLKNARIGISISVAGNLRSLPNPGTAASMAMLIGPPCIGINLRMVDCDLYDLGQGRESFFSLFSSLKARRARESVLLSSSRPAYWKAIDLILQGCSEIFVVPISETSRCSTEEIASREAVFNTPFQ
nr:hypothetical protein Iba_chr03cCG12160 [Ipomoea batatas]